FGRLAAPVLMQRLMNFGGMVKTGTKVVRFVFQFLAKALWGASLIILWVYLHHHHTDVVDDLHENPNFFTRWVEETEKQHPVLYYIILIALIVANIKFTRYIRTLSNTPTRLPGDSRT
ncbi:MAG: hypothetical protein AAF492_15035, partial [Verrucomicrobiota bacterium]